MSTNPVKLKEILRGLNVAVTGIERKSELLKLLRTYIDKSLEEKATTEEKITFMNNVLSLLETSIKVGQDTDEPRERFVLNNPNDVSSLEAIMRKPLKIVGIIAAAETNPKYISYINLTSQLTEARLKYAEAKIEVAVQRAIATHSPLRTYMDANHDLGLPKMLEILRTFYRCASATELFQQMSNLNQKSGESAFNFILRALELKAKLTTTAKAEMAGYSDVLIQDTF